MRTKTGVVALLLSVLCFFQCGMFEDIALFSGKDLGDIKVDVYVYDDNTNIYYLPDRSTSFIQLTPTQGTTFSLLWAVNTHNEMLTVEYNSLEYIKKIMIRTAGMNPVEKGYFIDPDYVSTLTAGPDGEFYLCAYVSGQNRLFILPPGAPAIQYVAECPIPSKIWAVRFRGTTNLYIFDQTSYTLYRSLNGGQTFDLIGTFSFVVQDIATFKDEVYFSSNEASNSIYKSSDGINFTAITGSPANSSVLHADRNRIFALTQLRVYFSDDGIHWLEGTDADGINNIAIDSDYTGRIYILSISTIWASDDFGNTSYIFSTLPSNNARKFSVVSYK